MTKQDAPATETVPGGKYLAADGKTLVDANGQPIKESKAPAKGGDA